MFTGIVQELGTVVRVVRTGELITLRVAAPKIADGLGLGESVAVSGVCLSVVRVGRGELEFEVVPETQRVTTVGDLRTGARVNLEPSLRLSDRLNGHIVLGHVDGTGRVTGWRQRGEHAVLSLRVPESVSRYCVPKGPIAVDGVSLTIGAQRSAAALDIFLIPETLARTTLGGCRAGAMVNLEADYLAKLSDRFSRASVRRRVVSP